MSLSLRRKTTEAERLDVLNYIEAMSNKRKASAREAVIPSEENPVRKRLTFHVARSGDGAPKQKENVLSSDEEDKLIDEVSKHGVKGKEKMTDEEVREERKRKGSPERSEKHEPAKKKASLTEDIAAEKEQTLKVMASVATLKTSLEKAERLIDVMQEQNDENEAAIDTLALPRVIDSHPDAPKIKVDSAWIQWLESLYGGTANCSQ